MAGGIERLSRIPEDGMAVEGENLGSGQSPVSFWVEDYQVSGSNIDDIVTDIQGRLEYGQMDLPTAYAVLDILGIQVNATSTEM